MSILIEPISEASWTDLVRKSKYSTPFHDYKWGQFVTDTLGGEYIPLVAFENTDKWLIPGYKSSPWVKSNSEFRIGSIGYGGPLPVHKIIDADTEINKVSRLLNQMSEQFNYKNIYSTLFPEKIWSELSNFQGQLTSTCKLSLTPSTELLFKNVLARNVRGAIRKAIKEGVVVRPINNTNDSEIRQAHCLLHDTQIRVDSSYITPYKLFAALASNKFVTTESLTFVAYHNDRMLSTATLIFDENEAFHLFHGWDNLSSTLRANQALVWHMISFAVHRGIQSFNMGKSHQESLLRAKLRWGGHLEVVPIIQLRV